MSPSRNTPRSLRHDTAVSPNSKQRQGASSGSVVVVEAPPGRICEEEEKEIAYALKLSTLGVSEPEPPRPKSSISNDSLLPPKKRKAPFFDLGMLGGDVKQQQHMAVVDPALRRELDRGLIKFGKTPVTEEFTSKKKNQVASTLEPPQPKEKLMSSAIRAAAAASSRSWPPTKIITTSNGTSSSGIPPLPPPPPNRNRYSNCSARVRRRLVELDATEPVYVCEKALKRSDVHLNQNRLLISCKRDQLAASPITGLFTAAETAAVQEQDEEEDKRKRREDKPKRGLRVTMLDDAGYEYAMLCRYLNSNGGYRFIEEWGKFLRNNGLSIQRNADWVRNVVVRLLAFRSRRLPGAELSGHRDGALGFVVLYEEFDGDEDDDEDDEEEYMVNAHRAKPEKKKNNERKEEDDDVKASTSRSAAAAAAATRAPRRSLDKEGSLITKGIGGIVKLGKDLSSSSSSSSSECDGSEKPSSVKQEKADD
uniref:Uncharacterized protein n=1 Tax=Leersia perrieri TaxID=77586 RepID=A0A0D9VAF4_9ORYZ